MFARASHAERARAVTGKGRLKPPNRNASAKAWNRYLQRLVHVLGGCMSSLAPRAQHILVWRTGHGPGRGQSEQQVARRLGTTVRRERQLESRAAQALRLASAEGRCGQSPVPVSVSSALLSAAGPQVLHDLAGSSEAAPVRQTETSSRTSGRLTTPKPPMSSSARSGALPTVTIQKSALPSLPTPDSGFPWLLLLFAAVAVATLVLLVSRRATVLSYMEGGRPRQSGSTESGQGQTTGATDPGDEATAAEAAAADGAAAGAAAADGAAAEAAAGRAGAVNPRRRRPATPPKTSAQADPDASATGEPAATEGAAVDGAAAEGAAADAAAAGSAKAARPRRRRAARPRKTAAQADPDASAADEPGAADGAAAGAAGAAAASPRRRRTASSRKSKPAGNPSARETADEVAEATPAAGPLDALAGWVEAGEAARPSSPVDRGRDLEAQGDLAAAMAAYRRADAAGDARGACRLAYLLESNGDVEGAIAAYARADERGDSEGSVGLGSLLVARGSLASALDAFERADRRGDPVGAFNHGVLLEEQGDLNGAIAALRRAHENGEAEVAHRAREALAHLGVHVS